MAGKGPSNGALVASLIVVDMSRGAPSPHNSMLAAEVNLVDPPGRSTRGTPLAKTPLAQMTVNDADVSSSDEAFERVTR